jgi:rubrerythrin
MEMTLEMHLLQQRQYIAESINNYKKKITKEIEETTGFDDFYKGYTNGLSMAWVIVRNKDERIFNRGYWRCDDCGIGSSSLYGGNQIPKWHCPLCKQERSNYIPKGILYGD